MPSNRSSLLSINKNENTSPERMRHSSRSPHPYSRRYNVISQGTSTLRVDSSVKTCADLTSSSKDQGDALLNADHAERHVQSQTPSDSGTEADDEKGLLLRGLPAPPSRPHKGFKGLSAVDSPVLTPSYLDDRQRHAFDFQAKCRTNLQDQPTDDETYNIRKKFEKKRRAELIRRISEIVLLGVVSNIGARRDIELFYSWYRAALRSSSGLPDLSLVQVPFILSIHVWVVAALYTLYPLRIIRTNQARNAAKGRSRFYIQLPAAFDPAPLIYPILLPVIVSLSVGQSNGLVVLPNLILSIASIPSKIIPLGDVPWYSSPHWVFSVIPVIASQIWLKQTQVTVPSMSAVIGYKGQDVEHLALLYPLHQALLPVLGHLTTTSLLPAELELLSVSMINLLLFSTSPQALILKSLLWIGGFFLLIFCSRILNWMLALARVPSWRFQRPRPPLQHGSTVFDAMDRILDGHLSRWRSTLDESDASGTEKAPEVDRKQSFRKRTLRMGEIDASVADTRQDLSPDHRMHRKSMAATWNNLQYHEIDSSGTTGRSQAVARHEGLQGPPKVLDHVMKLPRKPKSITRGKGQTHTNNARSFRSLTAEQATILKWLFAAYVYIVIAMVIVLPVRIYIRRVALHGQEPVGWALGYLFGDLHWFQKSIENCNLEGWIFLPRDHIRETSPLVSTWTSTIYYWGSEPSKTRLLICGYCFGIIAVGLVTVFRLRATVEVDTRRKVFHGMMVAMFLPTVFVDPAFVSLALGLVLAIFLLLDVFRASQLPPLAKPLTYFLAPYVDGRDHRGPVIVSHIFLLIGCAIPLWLSLAVIPRTKEDHWRGWNVEKRELSMISGVVCVGMGDAAASLFGRRYGRRRWCWSGGKSLEGSLAFTTAVILGLSIARMWLLAGEWAGDNGDAWTTTIMKATVAGVGASLTEAVLTGGNDNVIVPVVLWLLVRGLRM